MSKSQQWKLFADRWTMERLQIDGGPGGVILGFGRDGDGRLYALTTRFQEGSGAVKLLTPP